MEVFAVLLKAHRGLAITWWALLLLAGTLPAVRDRHGPDRGRGSVQERRSPAHWSSWVCFVVQQVVGPIRIAVSQNLGDLVSAWLNESLMNSCVIPPGIGHLEDPTLREDLHLWHATSIAARRRPPCR